MHAEDRPSLGRDYDRFKEGAVLASLHLGDDGDFLRLRWTPGVTIEADDIHSTIAAVTAASSQGKRPLLVHIGPVERITPEAKQCSSMTSVPLALPS